MSESFGDLNAIGQPREMRSDGYGGNNGRGPIDNVYPTGIVADGNEVRASDVFGRGVRAGASVQKNESKARNRARMSERR
jgi:hypothetical protein